MKTKNLFVISICVLMLASCSTQSFYQVYKVKSDPLVKQTENALVFEDENCRISYNLWAEKGSFSFQFSNKTENPIFLKLDESFFLLNGLAFDYFKNRTYTSSNGTNYSTANSMWYGNNNAVATQAQGITSAQSYSTSYQESPVVCIPAKSAKIFSEYTINSNLIRDCKLFLFPTKKQIFTSSFTKSESPLVFNNRLIYTRGETGKLNTIDNEFYVAEITNYPSTEIIKSKQKEFCGEKSLYAYDYYVDIMSPEKFYIKYIKTASDFKH